MIQSKPGETFSALLEGAPSGIEADLSVSIETTAGTLVSGPVTSPLVEVGAPSGIYVITGLLAPTSEGDYIVLWSGPSQGYGAEQLQVRNVFPESTPDPLDVTWRPGLSEVGALLRTRTKTGLDSGGVELGTFSAETRPTGDEVETLINTATGHVASKVGSTENLCEGYLTSRARGLAATYTAMLVELSYFPEQVSSDRSPYSEYKDLFDEETKSLMSDIERVCGVDLEGGSEGGRPSYDFTKTTTPLGMEFPW